MKSYLIEVPKKAEVSFQVLDYSKPYFHNPIHYHSALELTLITSGEGTRFVGDSIESFFEGDLVLLGSNLPHQWKNNMQHHEIKAKSDSKAIVIHFQEDCFGREFFLKNEAQKILTLLQNAKRGLKITGETKLKIVKKMHTMLKEKGFQRTLTLLQMLDIISNSIDLIPLASYTYRILNKNSEIEKLDDIYEYVLNNITSKITLSDISSKFHMSRTGFCRYFKRHTQKTFSKFVLEARISMACQMLHDTKLNMSQIAYESGFNQLSFFSREFKNIKGITPLKYRNQIQHNISLIDQ